MTTERRSDGYLFDLYRRYVGEPEDRTDVYLGFGLFLGGVGLAIVALLFFLGSAALERGDSTYWAVAQVAYALGMVSLPTTMLGIVVLLPAERRVVAASVVGAAVTLVAVGGFVYSYPSDWNFHGDNYTVHVVVTYAVGLAAISASTGAALIAHYLDRAAAAADLEADADEEEAGESYTDAEIRGDIDEAMDGVELSWGGVEASEGTRLSFTEDEFDAAAVDVSAKTTRSSGVDDQVAGLKGLKGGEKKTARSEGTVDDQTAKLKELRERKRRESEESAEPETGGPLGAIGALLGRVGGLMRPSSRGGDDS